VAQRTQTVILDLEGERATHGIELDGLERFIEHFRAALRDFERSATDREHQIGRGGHPDAVSMAATSFRLVGFRRGSAVLELEEPALMDEEALQIPTDGPATQNLKNLLDSIDAGTLDPVVVDDLEAAAIGDNGSFAVTVPARHQRGVVDAATITKLRAANRVKPSPSEVTVFGRLHLIETEGTPRVEVRATDGYNWTCPYPAEIEPEVLRLIKKQVRAAGLGVRERANRGTLQIDEIEGLPEYEQTPLFSPQPQPVSELERGQGIERPQGLGALSLENLPDDDAINRYLAIILED
jgi:hypothetical protein